MLSRRVAMQVIDQLSLLRYFPSEPGARAAIAELLIKMCATDEQAEWLGRRMLSLYNSWPGPMELRAVLSSKFRPADGIEANSQDRRFLEWGIPTDQEPSDQEPLLIESADPECRALVRSIADKKGLM